MSNQSFSVVSAVLKFALTLFTYLSLSSCYSSGIVFSAAANNDSGNDTDNDNVNRNKCTLYMAPTSTSDDNKLSMYAGTNIEKGMTIGRPEIAIPILHAELFNANKGSDNKTKPPFSDVFLNFGWNPFTTSSQFEVYNQDLVMSIPGVGALSHQHPTLVYNADWSTDSHIDRTSTATNGSGAQNGAGRGSFSHFYDMTLVSTDTIPAGMEILVNNLGLEEDEDLLKPEDFKQIDENVHKIKEFFRKHAKELESSEKLLSAVSTPHSRKDEIYFYLLKEVIGNDEEGKELAELFPQSWDEVEHFSKIGSFQNQHPELVKTTSWLEENGQCIDGLYNGPTTITYGTNNGNQQEQEQQKGAFATRSVKKGDVIAPTPLLLIPDKSLLDIYRLKVMKKSAGSHDSQRYNRIIHALDNNKVASQLLLNYSFGHKDSSLLFYPYGINVNFINHQSAKSSSRTSNGPNAKLVWTDAKYHDDELFDSSPVELITEALDDEDIFYRFGMNIVATRDIEADEEIFLDYGDEWSQEWENHVNEWNNDDSGDIQALDLNSAMIMNKDKQESNGDADSSSMYFHTMKEIESLKESNDYDIPDSIMTMCYLSWKLIPDTLDESSEEEKEEKDIYYQFYKETLRVGPALKLCDVVDRNRTHENEYEYTVKYYHSPTKKEVLIKGVPQKFIQYADRPYTSDVHLNGSFRHYIGIPDEIFPEAWRDLKT